MWQSYSRSTDRCPSASKSGATLVWPDTDLGKISLDNVVLLQTTEYIKLQTKRHVAENGSSVQKIQHDGFSILAKHEAQNPKGCTFSIKQRTQACRVWIQRNMLKRCKPSAVVYMTLTMLCSLLHRHTPRGSVLAPTAAQCLGVCLLVGYPFGTH